MTESEKRHLEDDILNCYYCRNPDALRALVQRLLAAVPTTPPNSAPSPDALRPL